MIIKIESRNEGKTPTGTTNKRHVGINTASIIVPVLLMALALTTAGCLDSSKTMRFVGSSMEPTIHDGGKIKVSPLSGKLLRGDIVLFTAPESGGSTLVKRIIGLPNETIEIKDGNVLINGVFLNEYYILEPPSYTFGPTVIPDKSYFVLGDNRNHSNDSHTFGAVPMENIQHIVETE